MTEIEAIKGLKNEMDAGLDVHTTSYFDECLQVAYASMEKQIPKKPIYKPYDDTCVYYEYACPDCEEWLDRNSKPHHCKCGQKILWD